ncbi:MAG: hypothetical protein KF819_04400 [Labilithrix sp.]|nr:hypothetical protein [Labilithrix sp.]
MLPSKGKRRESSKTAARCVGAQYVASLDSGAAGGLVEMPRVGAAMLFARVDERGRISLVRTSVLTGFESQQVEDPFAESTGVQTSAPEIDTPLVPEAPAPPDSDVAVADPDDYFDASDRTQRIQALRPEDIAATFPEAATAEYRAVESEPAPRTTLPSQLAPSNVPTLRNPHRDVRIEADDEYAPPPPRSVPTRGMLPRVRGSSAAVASEPMRTPRAYSRPAASDVQMASRRRRGT